MFVGFMLGLRLWYRTSKSAKPQFSDRTTCIYKFYLGKVDTVQFKLSLLGHHKVYCGQWVDKVDIKML